MGGKQKGRKPGSKAADIPPVDNYEVEKIVDSRVIKGKLQYKVHWVGYTSEEDTWENESQLDCPEVLEEYIATQNEDSTNIAKKQEKPSTITKTSEGMLNIEGTKYELQPLNVMESEAELTTSGTGQAIIDNKGSPKSTPVPTFKNLISCVWQTL